MQKYLLLIISLLVIGFTSLVSVPDSPYLIGGMTQADISNMFPSAITPAGVTFAIWSVIYLSWIVAGVYVAFFQKRANPPTPLVRGAIGAFSLAILLTGVWLVPWGYIWIGTALVVMLVILGLLKYTFHQTRTSHPLVKYSVELTLGWINIATVANITIWLLSLGFTGAGFSEIYWAIGVLALALGLTLYYQLRYRTYIISAVFLWTMLGEWIAHDSPLQRGFIIGYAVVILMSMVYTYSNKKR
jgi:TspO/MBR family